MLLGNINISTYFIFPNRQYFHFITIVKQCCQLKLFTERNLMNTILKIIVSELRKKKQKEILIDGNGIFTYFCATTKKKVHFQVKHPATRLTNFD